MALNPKPEDGPKVLPPEKPKDHDPINPQVIPPQNQDPNLSRREEAARRDALKAHAEEVKMSDKASGVKPE